MKSGVARLIVVCIALLIAGCKTACLDITSDPPGAIVYAGESKDKMTSWRTKTPYRSQWTDINPRWRAGYYQVKKTGFYDSEIIYKTETRGDRNIHFVLEPIVYEKLPDETWREWLYRVVPSAGAVAPKEVFRS